MEFKAWMSAICCCVLAAIVPMSQPHADSDKIVFPEKYAEGVMYTSHDLAAEKEFREFYITPAGFAAAQRHEPLPSGTVITLVRYNVRPDGQGNPAKDASGRFVKAEPKAYRVMEKRTGWGSAYAADKRNGEWEYQAFLADGKVDEKASLESCFQCHKNGDSANFMFTAVQLDAAAK
jgi:Cytochrome P460